MHKMKSFPKNSTAVILALTLLLAACTPAVGKTSATKPANLPSNVQATHQRVFSPLLLAEWEIGRIHDMVWSPDSKMFVVNYYVEPKPDYIVEAFSTESLKRIWVAENSSAWDLTFTPDGQFIVESDVYLPFFYWRNKDSGKVAHMGEFTSVDQITSDGCVGGGQFMLTNTRQNTALIADYDELIWLGKNHTVVIRQLNLETRKCKKLFEYKGAFTLFDLNSSGTLLAYGGVGEDNSVVIWDVDKQTEVCRFPKVSSGRFIPGVNTLAVVKEQKIVLMDALKCTEIRETKISILSGRENYLALSPDGKQIAIARDAIDIFDISTGELLTQFPFPEKTVPISLEFFLSGIKFSPDGRYLLIAYDFLSSEYEGKIQLWQLKP